jgi:hypothetical protein
MQLVEMLGQHRAHGRLGCLNQATDLLVDQLCGLGRDRLRARDGIAEEHFRVPAMEQPAERLALFHHHRRAARADGHATAGA